MVADYHPQADFVGSRRIIISQRVDQRVRYHKNSGDCNINTLSPSVLAYIVSKNEFSVKRRQAKLGS